MSSSYRPLSPPGSRRLIPPGRTPASSVLPSSSTYHDYPPSTRTTRDPISGPRNGGERFDAPRAIPIRPRSPTRRIRDDDFATRPRPRTLSVDLEDPQTRRPLSLVTPKTSSRINRPIVTKDLARPSSPASKSGGAQLEASFIVPASSSSGRHHHRHSSLTTGDRLMPRENGPKDRLYPSSEPRNSDVSGLRTSVRSHPPRERQGRDDRDFGYEYTNAKEEVLRDTAPRPRPRRESYTGARPTSMISLDRPDKLYGRIDKDVGPPVTSRGFEGIGRSESLRHRTRDDDPTHREFMRGYPRDERDSGGYRPNTRSMRHPAADDYITYPQENVRNERPRKPTLEDEVSGPRPPRRKLLPNDEKLEPRSRDSGRRKPTLEGDRIELRQRDPLEPKVDRDGNDRPRRYRESRTRRDDDNMKEPGDRDDRSRRNPDDPKDRREKSDRDVEEGQGTGLLVSGGGVAAATGMAAEAVRRHLPKESRDEQGRPRNNNPPIPRESDRDHASESTSLSGETRLSGAEEDREQRRRLRRREREREDRDYQEAREEERLAQDSDCRNVRDEASRTQELDQSLLNSHLAPPGQGEDRPLREQASYERPAAPNESFHLDEVKGSRHHSRTRTDDSYSDSSGSESSVNKARRRPRVVTPSNEMAPPPPPAPKGILKAPRERFPEDPNSIREGVAPLDAAKKGIPPEARWTRINRRLVNPEALEQEGIRFEEFPDHVIVLKVLSQEDINRFTAKTYEIREKRRVNEGVGVSGGSE